ncbi:MAG: SagB/ThcOx family dehydrogenase [Candidatus Omnitrophota bacterium]
MRQNRSHALLFLMVIGITFFFVVCVQGATEKRMENKTSIRLPPPRTTGGISVQDALTRRRSVRKYAAKPLTIEALSRLLWAAQGVSDSRGLRTAPSAGALYPLETYVAVGDLTGLSPGLYKYEPNGHLLKRVSEGDLRLRLAVACSGQSWIKQSAAIIIFCGVYERTTKKYGRRGLQYVHMEAGHAAENLSLEAVSMDLGTVVVGAFDDEEVKDVLSLPAEETPLCLMPIGAVR